MNMLKLELEAVLPLRAYNTYSLAFVGGFIGSYTHFLTKYPPLGRSSWLHREALVPYTI